MEKIRYYVRYGQTVSECEGMTEARSRQKKSQSEAEKKERSDAVAMVWRSKGREFVKSSQQNRIGVSADPLGAFGDLCPAPTKDHAIHKRSLALASTSDKLLLVEIDDPWWEAELDRVGRRDAQSRHDGRGRCGVDGVSGERGRESGGGAGAGDTGGECVGREGCSK